MIHRNYTLYVLRIFTDFLLNTFGNKLNFPALRVIYYGPYVGNSEEKLFVYGFPQFSNGRDHKGKLKVLKLQYMYDVFVTKGQDCRYTERQISSETLLKPKENILNKKFEKYSDILFQ